MRVETDRGDVKGLIKSLVDGNYVFENLTFLLCTCMGHVKLWKEIQVGYCKKLFFKKIPPISEHLPPFEEKGKLLKKS